MYSLLELCVLTAVGLFSAEAGSGGWVRSKQFNAWTLRQQGGVKVAAKDQLDCLLRCVQSIHRQCIAISFDESLTECRHYSIFVTLATGTGNTTAILTDRVSGVFITERGTFEEAESHCNYFGGRLMTYSELFDMYLKGAQHCVCGWISDGTTKGVSQIIDTTYVDCNIGIRTCSDQDRSKAWCTINA